VTKVHKKYDLKNHNLHEIIQVVRLRVYLFQTFTFLFKILYYKAKSLWICLFVCSICLEKSSRTA